MSNLTNLRKSWEKGLEIISTFPVYVNGFQKLLVVLATKTVKGPKRYSINRYFKTGSEWAASVDGDNIPDLESALAYVEKDKDKSDLLESFA